MKIGTTSYFGLLLISFLFVAHSSFINLSPYSTSGLNNLEYEIKPNSILEVNGKTNVNSFTCSSQEQFSNRSLSFDQQEGAPTIYFQDTYLNIKIQKLDCGSKPINKDLKKALKADQYPEIIISLKEALNLECEGQITCDQFIQFEASTDITITCETRSYSIPILIKKIDTNSFQIIGETKLQLCDFEIEPITALMGIIKVKDTFTINFDLYVDVH